MSRDLREILHSGYSFVRGVEANKASSAITLDHVIDAQIKLLKKGETTAILDAKGESSGSRTSAYDRLDALQKDIDAVVKAVKDGVDAVGSTQETS
jgi:hypothetical protein